MISNFYAFEYTKMTQNFSKKYSQKYAQKSYKILSKIYTNTHKKLYENTKKCF